MARGRKRKTDKGSFKEEQMKRAVLQMIEQGSSLRKAADQNNVKFQTLASYVKRQKQNVGVEIRMKPNMTAREFLVKIKKIH
ncbi:hypothetical protein NQ314_015342 [Rhamnusium bicolor]|uniref:HTH psq-type domain-containing protein n=1 Tax=Rhamnusium bicolor TaxID=1586634 RepID=A0AAV8WZN7_9CUCU|nr:hypothetical protein NQ314_015342 [Rhamnusium bicolor]